MTLKLRKILVAIFVLLVPLAFANLAEVATFLMNATVWPFGFERHSNIAFGNDESLQLDVYVPSLTNQAPVVVFWHGGMWRKGSKDEVRFVGAALAKSGIVAVIPNYRLYPQAQYRDFLDDGAQAVRWTRENAESFGGNAHQVFLMGHSAGAYIASMLAFDDGLSNQRGIPASCVRGLIGLAGPYTFDRPAVFLDDIFGESREVAWRPVDIAGADAPPTLLLHGEDDNAVWASEPVQMAARLTSLGVPVELRIYEGRSHQDMLIAWAPWLRFRAPVREEVRRFVRGEVGRVHLQPSCNS